MKTIMIVDDENPITEEIQNMLKEDDIEVFIAENTRKAIQFIEEKKEENVNLLLIKTSLPDEQTSAYFSLKPSAQLLNVDMLDEDDFLPKPFTKQQFYDFIRKKI